MQEEELETKARVAQDFGELKKGVHCIEVYKHTRDYELEHIKISHLTKDLAHVDTTHL